MAGVQIFDAFGFFPTLVSLSRKMGISYEQVLQMEADVIYMTLLFDYETAQYEKRLYEIRKVNEK